MLRLLVSKRRNRFIPTLLDTETGTKFQHKPVSEQELKVLDSTLQAKYGDFYITKSHDVNRNIKNGIDSFTCKCK